MKKRYDERDTVESIILKEIDESNEWLIGTLEFGFVNLLTCFYGAMRACLRNFYGFFETLEFAFVRFVDMFYEFLCFEVLFMCFYLLV